MRVSFPSFVPAALMFALLASCAQFPQIDAMPAGEVTAPPTLLPLDDLLAQANAPSTIVARGEHLSARAARLRNRARLMRGDVHDPATRARLAEAIRLGRA